MIEIARLPADERQELFHNAAAKTGLHDAIVEKDFWVCLTLDYLFHRCPWKKAVWSYVKKKYKLNMPFLRLAYPAKASAFSSNAASYASSY